MLMAACRTGGGIVQDWNSNFVSFLSPQNGLEASDDDNLLTGLMAELRLDKTQAVVAPPLSPPHQAARAGQGGRPTKMESDRSLQLLLKSGDPWAMSK